MPGQRFALLEALFDGREDAEGQRMRRAAILMLADTMGHVREGMTLLSSFIRGLTKK